VLIVRRRRRASQIVNLIDLDLERIDDVMSDQLELRILQKVGDVLFPAGEKVVQTQNLVALIDKPIT
ncbi:MAG TPA: hypothetical protein VFI76_04980, partial [Terrimicrobiaceae bacterium]|nr:hypothetical protein [Terrimicrobiaceae bacterium]